LRHLSFLALITALGLSLAGCGGGGGGAPVSRPAAPAEAPPPPPPPPTAEFDTPEYHADYGLAAMHTLSAYGAGLSGEGVTIGIVDTGIDIGNPEFKGGISPLSIDITTGSAATLQDENGHGTAVAGIAAARHNGSGPEGVAFDATILAVRADAHGQCDTCDFDDWDIARGIDYAVDNGARVVNLSMGGDAGPSPVLQAAILRAVAAGTVFVMSAGNDAAATPAGFASFAADARVKGSIVIAGATNELNTIADFSNRAGPSGSTGDVYLVAPGDSIRIVKLNPDAGYNYFGSGTSFSAPHITGAIALLMQQFPNLSGREILSILFETADDLGDPGEDAVYGKGLVDLQTALAPIGGLSVETASGVAVPLDGDLLPATAMGDAFREAFEGALAFDGRRRAYDAGLAQDVAPAPLNFTLRAALSDMRYHALRADLGAPDLQVGFALDETRRGMATTSLETHAGGFTPRPDIHVTTPLPGGLSFTVASGSTAGPGSTSVGGLSLMARGTDPASQISGWGERASASYRPDDRTDIGSSVFRARREAGETFDDLEQKGSAIFLRRRIGSAWELGVELGQMAEKGSVLGMTGTGVFDGFEGAETDYLQLDARFTVSAVTLAGSYMRSRTSADLNKESLFTDLSTLQGESWSLTLLDERFAADGHRWGLYLTSPLAVRQGHADLLLATGWEEDAPQYETRRIDLAPRRRETSLEFFHRYEAGNGVSFQSNVIFRRNPDNMSGHEAAVFFRLATPL
jgi:hypothetical protein